MEKNTTAFETGATSAAVNELILYTDNTRELAEKRDNIYEQFLPLNNPPIALHFIPLLDAAERLYNHELGKVLWSTETEDQEYCQIYANRFEEWKRERELNDK